MVHFTYSLVVSFWNPQMPQLKYSTEEHHNLLFAGIQLIYDQGHRVTIPLNLGWFLITYREKPSPKIIFKLQNCIVNKLATHYRGDFSDQILDERSGLRERRSFGKIDNQNPLQSIRS